MIGAGHRDVDVLPRQERQFARFGISTPNRTVVADSRLQLHHGSR